jgi:hypothetical protein
MAQHLSALESRGLKWVTETFPYCRDTAQLPKGVGVATLAKLVALGLAEQEQVDPRTGKIGYRTTPEGWRTMYGMTYEEMLAAKQREPVYPLRIWWRPVPHEGRRSG